MTNDGKENIRHITCTNHTTRYDRDLFRVCPSKLNKRELEDLYFSLLENNTQLKKTTNGQRDQIKVLTTKVNRMTGQKNALGNLSKDCCASTKAIINEQKETIADLKIANERLSDRIRLLNMRLCSAKQFLKRSPGQTTTRCTKCTLTPNQSVKNSSVCVLNTRGSEANLQSHIEAGSSQFLNKESSTIKADVMEASQTEMKDEACQQNKCRTLMDELKQKIENLEEDLSKTHEQYSERISKLEELISELRIENTRVRALHVESHHKLEFEEKKAGEMLRKLRDRELQCDNLATELQIEKGKVSELETQVKAADISSQIAEALENHLKKNMTKHRSSMVQSKTELSTLGLCASDGNCSPPMAVSNNSEMLKIGEPDEEKIVSKNSDDSGYAEKLDDKKECPKPDQNILDQIANLQSQLHKFQLSIKDNETSDDLKSVMVNSLQKSKLESNEIGVDAKNVNIPKQSKKNNTSDTSFEKHFTKHCNIVHDGNENSISIVKNINDSNKMTNHNNKEEISIENDNEKKRRSSILCTNQAEAKDLSVSYDKNKIIVGSSINIVDNKGTQGNYNGKVIRATCKSDSDSSVEKKVSERNLKKKILSKKAKDTESRHASLDVSVLEKECDLNIDNNGKEEVKLATPNTKENVESPVNTSSGNSTYTVEGKPAQSKLTKDATYPIENKLDGATFQADTHLAPTNKLTAKQSRVPQPMKTSTPKKHKIYKAEGSDEVTRSSSPDNTDNEISSLTDLPNEDKSLRDYISPGEEKVTSTFSDSYADATTTDYGSLSLGEVPISGAKKVSEVETRHKPTDSIEPSTTTNKMEEALHAIDEELTRCRELLRGQPPARVIPDLLSDYRGTRP